MYLKVANSVQKSLVLLYRSLYKDFESFFSTVQFFMRTFTMIFSFKWNHLWRISCTCDEPLQLHQNTCNSQTFEGQERVSIAEINAMMNRLGMARGLEDVNVSASFGVQELVSLFEEEEPSLEEIKETFKAFDVNNDGFIDASELRRVVCSLGLKERYELEECKKMIEPFCGNRDGLIDFQVFVKFMERCLC